MASIQFYEIIKSLKKNIAIRTGSDELFHVQGHAVTREMLGDERSYSVRNQKESAPVYQQCLDDLRGIA